MLRFVITTSLIGLLGAFSPAPGGDLALLLGAWGPCADCEPDFNEDGWVNSGDLAVLLDEWGS